MKKISLISMKARVKILNSKIPILNSLDFYTMKFTVKFSLEPPLKTILQLENVIF